MVKKTEEVISDLKAGKYAPIYFLQGEESYYIDQISDYIEENALQEAEKSFNLIVLYGKDVKVKDILGNARRFPMMAEKQVVIVREAQEIADLGKEEGQQQLTPYLNTPSPTTILVFCHKHKTVDRRKSFGKELEKSSVFVTTEKIKDHKMADWLDSYIKARGVSMDPAANRMMVEYIGNNLERMTNEVNKILLNDKEGKVITVEMIEKYVGISKEFNSFELQNALMARNTEKAFRLLQYFDANQKNFPPVMMITQLFTFFAKLLLVHQSADKSKNAIATLLKINPYFANDYLNAAKNFSLPQTVRAIEYIRNADMRSKGVEAGAMAPGEIMRELVIKILH
ncbi:MAG: DNA polymerase III subunit delta [Cyclobacteriaceae bacterium]|nr:DNA polymerase III subunit delta [Cyclobacteriaceae bacterium]